MLWEFKKNKNATEIAKKIVVFMTNMSSLTAKSETGFQSFILVICYWEVNIDQDIHQTLIKML